MKMISSAYEDNNYWCVVSRSGDFCKNGFKKKRKEAMEVFLIDRFGPVVYAMSVKNSIWIESKDQGFRLVKLKILYEYKE